MADTEQETAASQGVHPEGIGHVVLRVRDLERSTAFYEGLLGFKKVGEVPGRMAFFTATGENHHDLALQALGPNAHPVDPYAVGLYHVAVRLPSEEDVRRAYRRLAEAGADVVGSSDHGVSKSLYIKDPDGIELELFADVPDWKEQGLNAVSKIAAWDPR
jgi:catechol 2,3-dioxygenase